MTVLAELIWCDHCRSWRRYRSGSYSRGRCSHCQGLDLPLACGDCESMPCACPDRLVDDWDLAWMADLADHDALHLPHRRSGPFLVPMAQVIDLHQRRTVRWNFDREETA